MKKLSVLLAVLLLSGGLSIAFADDQPQPPTPEQVQKAIDDVNALTAKPAPSYTGSVGFSFGSANLASNPLIISNSSSGSVGSVSLSIDSDKVSAGLTIGLVPTITYSGGTNNRGATERANSDAYTLAKNELGWYTGRQGAHWGNGSSITFTNTESTLSSYAALTSASSSYVGDFVTINTSTSPYTITVLAAPTAYDSNYISRVSAFAVALQTAIRADILALAQTGMIAVPSSDWSGPTGTDLSGATSLPSSFESFSTTGQDSSHTGTYYFVLDSSGNAVALTNDTNSFGDAVSAYTNYYDTVYGAYVASSYSAAYPVSGASLILKKLFGVADLGLIYNKDASVGSMLTSANTKPANTSTKAGVSVGLSSGVVPGVSASLYLDTNAGTNAASENYGTLASEAATMAAPVTGIEIDGGYSTDMFGVKIGAMVGDLTAIGSSLAFSIQPSLTLADLMGLNVAGELTVARGFGMGFGAKVGASVMGISPSVTFKYKTATFGGDGTYNWDGSDSLSTSSLAGTFGSVDSSAAGSLDVAVSADLSTILGMKLLTANGGFQMFFGPASYIGYSGGLTADFSDLLSMPLTAGWSISTYDNAANGTTNDFTVGYTIGEATLGAELKMANGTNSFAITAKTSF